MAMIFAIRLMKMAKKSHRAITDSAEVAECLQMTEKKMDSPSQKAIYTQVNTRNTHILSTSSSEGTRPVLKIPTAPIRMPMEKIIMAMTVQPARNLPTMIESR